MFFRPSLLKEFKADKIRKPGVKFIEKSSGWNCGTPLHFTLVPQSNKFLHYLF